MSRTARVNWKTDPLPGSPAGRHGDHSRTGPAASWSERTKSTRNESQLDQRFTIKCPQFVQSMSNVLHLAHPWMVETMAEAARALQRLTVHLWDGGQVAGHVTRWNAAGCTLRLPGGFAQVSSREIAAVEVNQ